MRESHYRGSKVSQLVAEQTDLFTYRLAANRLELTPMTIRRYCEWDKLERVYLDGQPLVTGDSIRHFEQTARRYQKRRK